MAQGKQACGVPRRSATRRRSPPTIPDVLLLLCARRRCRRRRARDALEHALAIRPGFPARGARLGQVLLALGEIDDAERRLTIGAASDPAAGGLARRSRRGLPREGNADSRAQEAHGRAEDRRQPWRGRSSSRRRRSRCRATSTWRSRRSRPRTASSRPIRRCSSMRPGPAFRETGSPRRRRSPIARPRIFRSRAPPWEIEGDVAVALKDTPFAKKAYGEGPRPAKARRTRTRFAQARVRSGERSRDRVAQARVRRRALLAPSPGVEYSPIFSGTLFAGLLAEDRDRIRASLRVLFGERSLRASTGTSFARS